jgi:hypothetical protein
MRVSGDIARSGGVDSASRKAGMKCLLHSNVTSFSMGGSSSDPESAQDLGGASNISKNDSVVMGQHRLTSIAWTRPPMPAALRLVQLGSDISAGRQGGHFLSRGGHSRLTPRFVLSARYLPKSK